MLYDAIYPSLSIITIPISQLRTIRDLEALRLEKESRGESSSYADVINELFDKDGEAARKVAFSVRATIKAMNVYMDSELMQMDSRDDPAHSFIDSLPAEENYEVDESHIGACMDSKKYLAMLPPRSRSIICRHFGIGCEPQTYKEIGLMMNISGERARQIVKESLAKIKAKAGAAE